MSKLAFVLDPLNIQNIHDYCAMKIKGTGTYNFH
jgi:hypothetical protein